MQNFLPGFVVIVHNKAVDITNNLVQLPSQMQSHPYNLQIFKLGNLNSVYNFIVIHYKSVKTHSFFVNQGMRKRLTLNEDSTIKLIFQFSKNKLKSKRIPRPLTILVISYFSITRKSNNRRPSYTTSSRATNLTIVKKPTRINSLISLDDNTNNTHGFKIHLQYEFEICFGIEQISLQVLCLVPYNNNSRNKVILKVNLLTCRAEVVEL